MTARARKGSAQAAAEPLRLFAVEWLRAPANWIAQPSQLIRAIDEDAAWTELVRQVLDLEQPTPDRADFRLLAVIARAPERATPWGDGQFDEVQVGPGVRVALRVTNEGRVKMLSPGGEIDVTDGSASLGTGLHEAGARAAQIRARRASRTRRSSR